MSFPIGKEIYIDTPSHLVNLKELVAWIRLEKFNGVLIGKASDFITEILIFNGEFIKAFTYRKEEIIAEDDSSIRIFVEDTLARNNLISLFSYDLKLVRPITLKFLIPPKILEESANLFLGENLLKECIKEGTSSQLIINLPNEEIYFLFDSGVSLGYYSKNDKILKIDENFSFFNNIFEKKEGFLTLYQISLESFSKLKIPSLKFSYIEDELKKIIEKLIYYLNFVITFYEDHGIHVEHMETVLEKVDPLNKALAYVNGKFTLKGEILMGIEDSEVKFLDLIKKINERFSEFWGEKFITQKYIQAYKKFVEENKKDLELLEIIEELSPDKLEL